MEKIQLPYESQYACPTCCFVSTSRRKVKRCEETPIRQRPEVRIGQKIWRDELMWESGNNNGKIKSICWIVARLYYSQYGQVLRFGDDPLEPHTLLIRLIEQNCKTVPRDKTMTYAEFLLWREVDRGKLELARSAASEKPAKESRWKFWKSIRIFSEI